MGYQILNTVKTISRSIDCKQLHSAKHNLSTLNFYSRLQILACQMNQTFSHSILPALMFCLTSVFIMCSFLSVRIKDQPLLLGLYAVVGVELEIAILGLGTMA